MPDEETSYTETLFESIRHVNDYGEDFWYARELQSVLEYSEWRNFKKVIEKSMVACDSSENSIADHFVDLNKMVIVGSGAERQVDDYALSHYTCHLIVQNGDLRKKISKKTNIILSVFQAF